MIRTKGEAGTGDIVHAVKHLREVHREMKMLTQLSKDELMAAAKRLQAPVRAGRRGRRDGQAARAELRRRRHRDARRTRRSACSSAPRRSSWGRGSSSRTIPENRARAIVKATTHWRDADALLAAEESLGSGMKGIEAAKLSGRGPAPDARMVMEPGPVAVLALQGDFEAHRKALAEIGVESFELRRHGDLARRRRADHPGRRVHDALEVLRGRALGGGLRRLCRQRPADPRHVRGRDRARARGDQPAPEGPRARRHGRRAQRLRPAGRLVRRRGRRATSLGGPLPAVFIRAPRIRQVGPGVEVLATHGGEPVLVRQGNVVAATFHPELTGDRRLHRLLFGQAATGKEERLSLVSHRDARRDRGPDPESPEGQRLLARARRGALRGARRAVEGARRRARVGRCPACSRPAGTCRCSSTATAPGWSSSSRTTASSCASSSCSGRRSSRRCPATRSPAA